MKILGIKFAPLNIPLQERLQALGVAIWIGVFVFGDAWGLIITAYCLLYTQTVRYFMLLYFLWMYYDWDTCNFGGRSGWITRWIRNHSIWKYFCDYFPIKLVKTVDLDPKRSYLFISVPHGIFSSGIVGTFTTYMTGSEKLFPGLEKHMISLEQHFKIPIFRELMYGGGCCSSSMASLEHLLSAPPRSPYTGTAAVLIVGGASEAMEIKPNTQRIILKRRKGFVKLALKCGSPLVPVYSFGETDLYDQVHRPEGSIFRRFQHYIRKSAGFAPIFLKGRGFFQYSFGLLPHRKPVNVVVGGPMEVPKIPNPTAEEIDEYHGKFMNHMTELFEAHKHKYLKDGKTAILEFL